MFRDPRWHEREKALLDATGWACVECNDPVEARGVHVCVYPKGKKLWDYPARAFKVLCQAHREERISYERQLKDLLPEFDGSELGVFVDALDRLRSLPVVERPRAMEEFRAAVGRGSEWTFAEAIVPHLPVK
jgi:hypothetical protein